MEMVNRFLKYFILRWAMLGLCISLLSFGIVYGIVHSAVDDYMVRFSGMTGQGRHAVSEFQIFVRENNISLSDTEQIEKWVSWHRLPALMISGNDTVGDSHGSMYSDNAIFQKMLVLTNIPGYQYEPVTFSDGQYRVFIDTGFVIVLYSLPLVVSAAGSIIIGLFVLLKAAGTIVRRIRQLDQEVSAIRTQGLSAPITISGTDELSHLASEINAVRSELKKYRDREDRQKKAQKNFMNGISHDLRTPMTVILSYLDLACHSSLSPEVREYIEPAYRKALELRNMTNELFTYFLLDTKTEMKLSGPEVIFSAIGDQLSEFVLMLHEDHFETDISGLHFSNKKILFDSSFIGRIIDNILSNIEKYAVPGSVIRISMQEKESVFVLSVENRMNGRQNNDRGYGIGLKNIEEMMRLMKGHVRIRRDRKKMTFCISLLFPIQDGSEAFTAKGKT